jgi:hypothetical protein
MWKQSFLMNMLMMVKVIKFVGDVTRRDSWKVQSNKLQLGRKVMM